MPYGLSNDIAVKFQEYFGISVWDYWDKIFGFDIVKFDDFLRPPDDISIRDYITEKYSKDASDFIANLVSLSPYKGWVTKETK